LVGMPEILREFAEYRMLIYGALLVLMMLQRPEGLIPSAVRQRELKGQNPDDNPRLEHDLHRAGALDSETTIH
jgi:hypothetical protein